MNKAKIQGCSFRHGLETGKNMFPVAIASAALVRKKHVFLQTERYRIINVEMTLRNMDIIILKYKQEFPILGVKTYWIHNNLAKE